MGPIYYERDDTYSRFTRYFLPFKAVSCSLKGHLLAEFYFYLERKHQILAPHFCLNNGKIPISYRDRGKRKSTTEKEDPMVCTHLSLKWKSAVTFVWGCVQPYHANLSVTYTPSYPNPKLILICAHDFGTTQLRKSKRVIKRKHITKWWIYIMR